ncbi:MAG: type II and III secretion system protein [Gammaproteobacteria bacterium]|nr:type II and III secretion system protein [Gammaproteobacteria bacterium]
MLSPKKNTLFFAVSSLLTSLFLLQGCQESSVKRDLFAPPVAENLRADGHILPKVHVKNAVSAAEPIPSIIHKRRVTLPKFKAKPSSLYSITAVNVPVAELLYQVARDAGKQIDLYEGITGNVTINALNQPLNRILERISEQSGLMFKINGNTVVIKPDYPEWRNYQVDYVNISKTTTDSIDMKMSVSSNSSGKSGGNTKSGGSKSGSSTQIKVTSEHDFWSRLKENIEVLAVLDPMESKTVSLQGGKQGSKASTRGSGSSKSQVAIINPEVGVISVYTTDKKHKAIKRYIDQVSKRAQNQVLIEATIVEVRLSDEYRAGIDWSNFGSLSFTSESGLTSLTANTNVLQNVAFLQTFGDTKVLSSPKIMAINNQTALIKVVENQVYFTVDVNTTAATNTSPSITSYSTEVHTVPIGFTMSITPFVGEDDTITLNVRPTISKVEEYRNDPNPELAKANVESPIPIVQEKEMSSVLRLRDKQTAILGGLIQDQNFQNRKGLPWLSDIPAVGDLFSQRDDRTVKTELVIFIRPTIIKNPDIDHGDLRPVGRFLRSVSP